MKYILFAWMVNSGGAGGITMQEFNSLETCEAARTAIYEAFHRPPYSTVLVCVQK